MVHELDLIQTFLQESLHRRNLILSSPVLKAHYVCGSNQLIGREQGLIAAIALEQEPLTILVNPSSCYHNLIHQILTGERFLPISPEASTGSQSFLSYRQVHFPQEYQFNCTQPDILWRAWWRHRQQLQQTGLLTDLLIWVRYQWYPVRSLAIQAGKICVKSLLQEIVLSSQETIIWLEKIQTQRGHAVAEGQDLRSNSPLHYGKVDLISSKSKYAAAV